MPLVGSHHPNYSTVASAIDKKSISNLASPAPIEITRLGVAGDEQADLSVHGGIEKAIYVYPIEHYDFWNALLTRETKKSVELPLGAFGENFTVRLVGQNLLDGSKDETFNKFDNIADQMDRDFDEYELETEKAGPVVQLIGRYSF